MLIGSFLDFYTSRLVGRVVSAWSGGSGFGLFGIATVVVLCGVVMAAQVALADVRERRRPARRACSA